MSNKNSEQMEVWASSFGKEYTDRNPQTADDMDKMYLREFGVARSQLNREFLDGLDRDIRILEVGCNVGSQLASLQKMGFKDLYGVELQSYAVEKAKSLTKGINIIQGSGFDLPFKDGFFDLVYTSGVLIHIAPADLPRIVAEMARVSKQYLWGFEYFAEEHQEINYRGSSNLLWKGDFKNIFMKQIPQLKLIKSKRVPYLSEPPGRVDEMYLMER